MSNRIKRLRKLINKLVSAAIEDSWSGAGDPQDIPLLKAKYDNRRKDLNTALDALSRDLHSYDVPE